MRIRPDAAAASREQARVRALVREALAGVVPAPGPADASDPALVALAYAARCGPPGRRPCPAGPSPGDPSGAAAWPEMTLAAPAPHLRASLRRALAALPPHLRARGTRPTAVTSWRPEEAATFAAAAALLGAVWPPMLAELRALVTQTALVDGPAMDAVTDFTAHGAVLVNRRRLTDAPNGLPGTLRLAETLVHEGALTRCNAAAAAGATVLPAWGDGVLPRTPPRGGPGSPSELIRRLVALVRCAELYRLAIAAAPAAWNTPARAAATTRHVVLLEQAGRVAAALDGRRHHLTPRGAALLAEAGAALGDPRAARLP